MPKSKREGSPCRHKIRAKHPPEDTHHEISQRQRQGTGGESNQSKKSKSSNKGKLVQFYPDMAAELQKKQKEFDPVRRQLQDMGVRHDMLLPARLLVTFRDKTQTFGKPDEAEAFVRRMREEDNTG